MRRNPRLVFVGNIPDEADYNVIHSAFIPFGDIKEIRIPVDPVSNERRGYALVEFDEEEDAEHSIFNMHNGELGGRILRVERAKPQKDREVMNRPVWADDSYYEDKSVNS